MVPRSVAIRKKGKGNKSSSKTNGGANGGNPRSETDLGQSVTGTHLRWRFAAVSLRRAAAR
jgi:hypothetical protein